MSRKGQPKNRAPAAVQISAEHLIREATDLKLDFVPPRPKTFVVDEDEANIERLEKRKSFENIVRTNPGHMGEWSKYALWEESQGDFERARSCFERALGVNHKVHSMWVKYAEMEAKHRFINRARNVWDRAVTVLPRIDMLWYKYAWMEEQLDQLPAARAIYARWMKWEPKESGWMTYVNFEVRYKEWAKARDIMARYVECHKYEATFIKWATWEMYKAKDAASSRQVYSRAISELPEDELSEQMFLKFSKFEEKCNESERARVILTFALTKFPRNPKLEQAIVSLEKRHGTVESIEDAVLSKRRHQYEQQLIKDGGNEYDTWFDYIKLEENHAIDALRALAQQRSANSEAVVNDAADNDVVKDDILSSTRDTYERAISNVPPVMEKKYWKRYIYIWIKYALFEELVANNMVRTKAVYLEMLKLIPHEDFTFAKAWIMYSTFEIRQNQLTAARKALGKSLGLCPKHKLFRSYIELERSMGNVDRCRKLYSKYLEWCPSDQDVWVQYARLEGDVGEEERCRAVYDVALSLGEDGNDDEEEDEDNEEGGGSGLDQPEVVWKSYIDYEITLGQVQRARVLYGRLLQETSHVKVWLSLVRFEEDVRTGKIAMKDAENGGGASSESPILVRGIFEKGYAAVKEEGDGESRALMLKEWLKYEKKLGMYASAEEIQILEGRQAKRVKRKRKVDEMDANNEYEEYYDYLFPEDEKKDTANLKILQIAQKWKAKQAAAKRAQALSATAAAVAKVANAVSNTVAPASSKKRSLGSEGSEGSGKDEDGGEQAVEEGDGEEEEVGEGGEGEGEPTKKKQKVSKE